MTREEAIKVLERISEDTIQRDCSTCGRTTAGTYTGVCCYCSLCKVVPEMFEDYHERKHFRSYWTWDGKRKNEALDMAISALRQQEHFRDITKKVEPMTLDDAIAHLDDTLSDTGRKWSCESCRMEHVQLRAWLAELRYIKRKRNAPLTLDELRQMDGEPVWIVEYPDWGHWELSADAEDYVTDREPSFYGMKHNDPAGRYGLHKLGWLAYRQKPEEDDHDERKENENV